MERIYKQDKENLILKKLYEKKKCSIVDLKNLSPAISEKSLYRHINDLESQKFIEKISLNPIVIQFHSKLKKLLLMVSNLKKVKYNDLKDKINFEEKEFLEIIDRFYNAHILKYNFENGEDYIVLFNNNY